MDHTRRDRRIGWTIMALLFLTLTAYVSWLALGAHFFVR